MATTVLLLFALSLLFFTYYSDALRINYYEKSCPKAENLVTVAVKKGMDNDKTVPAALLRMHFHDCFIRSGGPNWTVPTGRKDGRISRANETIQLPNPIFNFTQLKQNFAQRGLSTSDLVVLSGGHTLGFAHCSSFQKRIHSFNNSVDIDPSLSSSFAVTLRKICPVHNKVRSAGATMDSTGFVFDNAYYKLLLQGEGLFSSDQALLTNPKAKRLITKFANSQEEFYKEFVKSMVRMSSLSGGMEIRLDCKVVR